MSAAVTGCVAGMVVLLLGARARPAVLPARAGVGIAAPPRVRPMRRRRPRPPSDLDVAAWCDDIARGVRSGSSLTIAVREATIGHSTLDPIVEPIVRQIDRGHSLGAATRAAPTEPSSAIGLALTVLRSCAELGGPAASPLERAAATLRDRDAVRQEQQAHSSQARMSARVMTLIPVGMLALLAGTDPTVRSEVGTPAGFAAVAAGGTLNVVGWWWMRRIIGGPR